MSSPNSIAIRWHIDDVWEIRPDLNDYQCREVLRAMLEHHDASLGINWATIGTTAEWLFPAGAP